ncbi:Mov34/MPN/PAD-1 family protein [Sorangium sp. So ce1389]|uniref:Mov34/MPN/PAD-1 family protein n=1 Tax=Sorangium sp. So ce1389 TaxID=3133336 RepID=UPI003F63FC87
MLKIRLSPEVYRTIENACLRARERETGGMLFAEHVAEEEFLVLEATVAGTGSVAGFLRALGDGLTRLERFFRRTRHDYRRYNYIGEWHSHPSFALQPSWRDDETMHDIVSDPSTGALFAVSVIVKIENDALTAKAWAYFPNGERSDCEVVVEAHA